MIVVFDGLKIVALVIYALVIIYYAALYFRFSWKERKSKKSLEDKKK